MNKSNLLFYDAYESFYDMVEQNDLFSSYCENVFGIDFSQDGFSDINQVKDLINIADIQKGHRILDIGCGNGKMAEYIADQTNATVYGFDYSKKAIDNANSRVAQKNNLIFEEGLIGEKKYATNMFDTILSVDTMYFAEDMDGFVRQIYHWLKPKGIFIALYGEGHMKKISANEHSNELVLALKNQNIQYDVVDYTEKHYELMRHKRKVANKMKEQFVQKGIEVYYDCAISQSVDSDMSLEEFKKEYNRYMYIFKKGMLQN